MENISVYASFKPTIGNNFIYDSKIITNKKTKEKFTFDSIINPFMLKKDIFKTLIKQNLTYLLKGVNFSILAYGETGTGKQFLLNGNQNIKEGLSQLCLKEIFKLLNIKKFSISKYTVKISYYEIYNEVINDLIDISKKNLEIKETISKGAFVHNLSEVIVQNADKAIQILNKGESNKKSIDKKIEDKSNKSHNVLEINLEYYIKEKNGKKENRYTTKLNLVKIAGSENLSIDESEGNMNKSLSSLNKIINKLSKNNKSLVNYKSSKLTRLLQNTLEGNSKTILFCTMIDDDCHYSETLNTIYFGLKAKNIKTNIKLNIANNNKGKEKEKEKKILKNKIKVLEKLINDKKSTKEDSNIDDTQINQQIVNLEKEVSLLKRYLMKNEEMGSDLISIKEEGDWMNPQDGNNAFDNSYLNNDRISYINTSAYKNSFKQRLALSAMRCPGSALKSAYVNSPFLQNKLQPDINNTSNANLLEINNNFKRNVCMTEMRAGGFIPKFFFHSIGKTAPQNNNFMENRQINVSLPDLNNTISNDMGNTYLIKENEELKNNLYELKKTYYEVVQSKEKEINLLNQNHNISLQNCEKLIKEAESNYINLKNKYEDALDQIKQKENESNDLKQKNITQDSSINFYIKELNKVGDFNYANEIENKYNDLLKENQKLKEEGNIENSKLREENELLKNNIEMIESKYKEKCQELTENQKNLNNTKKKNEKELNKYVIEVKNIKALSKKNNNIKPKENNMDNDKAKEKEKEYKSKIDKLMEENSKYKTNLENIEKIQIPEYQKLLDDSFDKIAKLNEEIINSKNKNKYLEETLNFMETNTYKDNNISLDENSFENKKIEENQSQKNQNKNKKIQSTIRQKNNDDVWNSNIRGKNNQEFLNKKTGTTQNNTNTNYKKQIKYDNQTSNKENNNILNITEFSNFEI